MSDSMAAKAGLSALIAVQDFRPKMFSETDAEYLACKSLVAGRAAIEAMRHLTPGMHDVLRQCAIGLLNSEDTYGELIDEALK